MFQGPKGDVLPFFEALGFRPLPRQGTADFLQEVVSRRDQPVRPCPALPDILASVRLHQVAFVVQLLPGATAAALFVKSMEVL